MRLAAAKTCLEDKVFPEAQEPQPSELALIVPAPPSGVYGVTALKLLSESVDNVYEALTLWSKMRLQEVAEKDLDAWILSMRSAATVADATYTCVFCIEVYEFMQKPDAPPNKMATRISCSARRGCGHCAP